MTAEEAAEAAPEEAPHKSRLPIILAGAALLCVASAAAAYFIAPGKTVPARGAHGDGENTRKADTGTSHGKKNSHKKGDGDVDPAVAGRFSIVDNRGVYTPEEIVISIRPSGRIKHLKLSIAVETDADSADAFLDNEIRIRDALNTYLRAVDASVLEDPASLGRIRAQIARRIELVVTPAPVDAVLITDFILS